MIAVGVHGAHGNNFGASLFDASCVVKNLRRKRANNADVVVLGDFNCDVLPTLATDLFASWRRQSNQSSERAEILNAWSEHHNLKLHIPEQVFGIPGGHWNTYCIGCPISRVPLGDQEGFPSLIDYVFF